MAIIKTGNLNGRFGGFRNRETVFAFRDGERWQQDEYRYVDGAAYCPKATIHQEGSTFYISVDGIESKVHVVKVY